jgi:ribonuclease HII
MSKTSKCSLEYEEALRASGAVLIAGVDEAGRGPLAGPVVAAAVVLPSAFRLEELDDSKKLSAARRASLRQTLLSIDGIFIGIGRADVHEIDKLNILRATHEAMRRAIAALRILPDHVLIDGLPVHPFPVSQTAIVGGDAKSKSIAAASILAKETRDEEMLALDATWPEYGFASHKGYGTKRHLAALENYGPCPAHRKSFAPVARCWFSLAQ